MPSRESRRPVLTRAEFEAAFCALSPADLNRLPKIAATYCRRARLEPKDLLQEALARTLDGSRNCPRDVDVVRFLDGAMHSIASDKIKALGRRPELHAAPLLTDDGSLAIDPPDPRPNPEEQLADAQEFAAKKQAVLNIFADDPIAQIVVEGIMEGTDGEELRGLTELDNTAFASKRRLIRRRFDKAFPKGWKP
jgi:DNA-directed RNA polymerase specialized sigma24 family protein